LAENGRSGFVLTRKAVAVGRARLRLWTGHIADSFEEANIAFELRNTETHAYVPIAAYHLTCAALELPSRRRASISGEHRSPIQRYCRGARRLEWPPCA
jgi:hypothetical protein